MKWECFIPAGLGASQFYINYVLTTFASIFIVNGGGTGTKVTLGSGSTGGVDRVTYHDNFGVTIYEESSTKTLSVQTMGADNIQVIVPEGKRDYTIILPDNNPRSLGNELNIVSGNLLGNITLTNQNLGSPQILYNELRTIVMSIVNKEIIRGINTVENNNVYIGFEPSVDTTHTGEVTGDIALVISDNIIDEANLKLPAPPTNDYVLIADSTALGGMKWAALVNPSPSVMTSVTNQNVTGAFTTVQWSTINLDFSGTEYTLSTANNNITFIGADGTKVFEISYTITYESTGTAGATRASMKSRSRLNGTSNIVQGQATAYGREDLSDETRTSASTTFMFRPSLNDVLTIEVQESLAIDFRMEDRQISIKRIS